MNSACGTIKLMWEFKRRKKRRVHGRTKCSRFYKNKFEYEILNFDPVNLTLDLHSKNANTEETIPMSLNPITRYHCPCARFHEVRQCRHMTYLRKCFPLQVKKNADLK